MKIVPFGLVGAAILAAFFLPFYFCNQQAFYDMYAGLYNQVTREVTASIIGNLQSDIEFSEQEKERLEETLSDVDGPLNDEEGVLTVDLDLEKQKIYRKEIPVWDF